MNGYDIKGNEMLNSLGIGTWVIEIEENKKPRMMCDEIMLHLLGIEEELTPEDTFALWFNNIEPSSSEKVDNYVNQMLAGKNSEVEYTWIHPKKGVCFVRCNGSRDMSVTDKIVMYGCHRDVSQIVSIQEDKIFNSLNYSEIANALAQNYDSIYVVDADDDTYFEVHAANNYRKLDINTTGKNFFSETMENLKLVCHPEDLEGMTEFMDKANVMIGLNGCFDKSITYDYRLIIDGEPNYYRIKALYIPGDIKHLLFAVENIEKEVRTKLEEEKTIGKIEDIIQTFARDFNSVFIINGEDGSSLPVSAKGQKANLKLKKYDEIFESYLDKFVYNIDKPLFANISTIGALKEELKERDYKEIEYRDVSYGVPQWFVMKVTKLHSGGNTDYLMGFSNKHELVTKKIISDKMLEDYTSIFIINLHDDLVTKIVDRNPAESVGVDTSNVERFMHSLVQVFDEDTKNFWRSLNRDFALENYLANENHKEIVCRTISGKRLWRRAAFTVLERQFGKPMNILLTFKLLDQDAADKEALNIQILEQKKELETNLSLIQGLASEYQSLYYLNLDENTAVAYAMNPSTERLLGSMFRKSDETGVYSDAFALYVKSLVSEEDKERMARIGDIANLKNRLSTDKSFTTVYKNSRNQYCEMKVVKVSGPTDQTFALMCFANKDTQLRRERENETIISSLSADYSFVFIMNKGSDKIRCFRMDPIIGQLVSDHSFLESYSKMTNALITRIVHPDDVERITRCVDIRNVLSVMNKKNEYSFHFRGMFRTGIQYWQAKYIMIPGSDEVIIGFSNIDKQIREEIKEREALKKNLDIINILAYQYSCVFYLNFNDESVLKYSTQDKTIQGFGDAFTNHLSYSAGLKKFIELGFIETDKERIVSECSLKAIKNELTHYKTATKTYKCIIDGALHFIEIKFVKVDDENAQPTAAVVAFTEKDNEIVRRYADKKLMQDYAAIYLIDFDTDTYITVSKAHDIDVHCNERGSLSKLVKYFATVVDPESSVLWNKMADISYMKKEYFKDQNRREFIYSIPGLEKRVRRIALNVIERDSEGNVLSAIASFVALDKESVEKLEMSEQIKRQKMELEQQSVLLEQALVKAESANRAKTTFLSNMSHDIRTPMNAIIGFTNLALANPNDKEKVQSYLEKTSTSSKHLLSLINDILDMSRIESGKIHLEETQCSLAEIMNDLSTIIAGQVQTRGQKLFIDTKDLRNENVICDKLRLRQVLINIVGNSIKFTPEGGEIRIVLQEMSYEDKKATYCFHIKDSGVGMSEEFVKKIFEPFEREYSSTISRTQGTGLGMAITKNIVDMMGGKIEVKSKKGKGTEFTVTLTFNTVDDVNQLFPLEGLEGKEALVIDDDLGACNSVAQIAERLSFKPTWCMHAEEALFRAKQAVKEGKPYSLFLIDYVMPQMSGLTLAKAIREAVGPEPIIILMTAYDCTSVEEEGMESGINGFISKPLFATTLHTLIAKELNLFGPKVKENPNDTDCFKGKKILLVEDNELNREIAKEILEEDGFIIDCAEDGAIALKKVSASVPGQYDLILMDVQMPNMNGYEATREIRKLKEPLLANIPIIAMTANAFEEDRKAAFDAGMNEHVAKPIDLNKLKEALKKFM